MTNSVGAPHGAEAAPQAGDVSCAVVPESDGVGRVCGVIRRSTGVLPDFIMSVTATDQESTAPASSPVPEVTGA